MKTEEKLNFSNENSDEIIKNKEKIKNLQQLKNFGVYNNEEIQVYLAQEIKFLEDSIEKTEKYLKKDQIKEIFLHKVQNFLEIEAQNYFLEQKDDYESSLNEEKKSLKLEQLRFSHKKPIDFEKINEKLLILFQNIQIIMRNLENYVKYGVDFELLRENSLRSIRKGLREEISRKLEQKLFEFNVNSDNENAELLKEINELRNLLQKGMSLEFIKEKVIEKLKLLPNLTSNLEDNIRKKINNTEISLKIERKSKKMAIFFVEFMLQKAKKYLLFSIFPSIAPFLTVFELLLDENVRITNKGTKFLIKFDYLFASKRKIEISVSFDSEKISQMFELLTIKLKKLISEAWGTLTDQARMKIKDLFETPQEIITIIEKLFGNLKSSFQNLEEIIEKKKRRKGVLKDVKVVKEKNYDEEEKKLDAGNILRCREEFLQTDLEEKLRNLFGKKKQ